MPGRHLLDTSALLAHVRREPGWPEVQELFDDSGAELFAASISLTELARRLRELGASVEEARDAAVAYAGLVDQVVPVDEAVALAAFELGCATPTRLPLTDALIAAAAREHQACLVHRDAHFAQIPEHLLLQRALPAPPDSG